MRLLFIVLIYVKSPHIPGVSLSAPPPQSIGASEQMCSSWNDEMLIFNNPIVCIFIFDGWWGWMLRNSQCYKSPGPHKSYRVTNDLEYETRVSKQKYLCLCTQDTNLFLNISKGLTLIPVFMVLTACKYPGHKSRHQNTWHQAALTWSILIEIGAIWRGFRGMVQFWLTWRSM